MQSMTGKIFINYRREDSAGDVMLVLIGRHWLTLEDENGQLRLDDPHDFVRVEIATALNLGKCVIPVLVHDKAEMPRLTALPEDLQPLVRRQAIRLTHVRFKADTQGLIITLEGALREADAIRRQAAITAAEEQRLAAEQADEAARAEKQKARLEAIVGLSPEHIAKAEELANWSFIRASKSSHDFRDHMARFPRGTTYRYALARLDMLVWQELGSSIDDLRAYLDEFPTGRNAESARARIAALEPQNADTEAISACGESSTDQYSYRFVAIDFGTTNSCVAVMDGKTPKVIENAEGATPRSRPRRARCSRPPRIIRTR
jgi:hypothetical protein